MISRLNKSSIRAALIAALIFAHQGVSAQSAEDNVKLLLEMQTLRQELAELRNQVERQSFQISELQRMSGIPVSDGNLPASSGSVSRVDPVVPSSVPGLSPDAVVNDQSQLGEIPAQSGGSPSSAQLDFPIQPQSSNTQSTVADPVTTPKVLSTDASAEQTRLLEEGDKGIKTNLSEFELYNKGIAKLQAQQYKSAASIFSAQLQNYPRGAKAGDAYFWLAETFYILNDLDSSAKSYESLFSLFPKHPRAPKALLKLIRVYQEKNDKTAAKSTLGKLVNLYPASPEAAEAKKVYSALL